MLQHAFSMHAFSMPPQSQPVPTSHPYATALGCRWVGGVRYSAGGRRLQWDGLTAAQRQQMLQFLLCGADAFAHAMHSSEQGGRAGGGFLADPSAVQLTQMSEHVHGYTPSERGGLKRLPLFTTLAGPLLCGAL